METERLRQFKTVVDAQGLLKASELLGISGGGLSKSLKTLENELGYKLFFQRGRELELTENGKKLYERLPGALEVINGLFDLDVPPEFELKQPLRFASFEVFTTYFLASFIADDFPADAVEIREAIPGEMEKIVADAKADIGITYEPIPTKGVDFLKAATIRMGIFGASEYQRKEFEALPFVVPVSPVHGAPSGARGLDGWPEHLFERNVRYKVEMMETAIQLCRQGVAVSFLPAFVAELYNKQVLKGEQLVGIELPKGFKTVSRDVYIVLRKNFEEGKVVKKLARSLRGLG